MKDLVIYVILAVIGYFAGENMKGREQVNQWTGRIQTAAIVLLLVTMGLRMGSNEEVTSGLAAIGVSAVVMTLVIMLFSGLAAFTARKLLLGMDRWAKPKNSAAAAREPGTDIECADFLVESQPEEQLEDGLQSQKRMAVLIFVSVITGLLSGCFFVTKLFDGHMETFNWLAGFSVNAGLYILLFLVGYNMGLDGTVIENFRKVGVKIILFPFVVMAGAILAGAVFPVFFDITLKESLAVTAGFGWYSLAPGLILEAGLTTCGAISFIHCILREYFSLLLVPVVAKKIGYMEAVGICGATAMGVCLPIVERSTRGDVVIYSFISGLIHTVSVPIIVPLILG